VNGVEDLQLSRLSTVLCCYWLLFFIGFTYLWTFSRAFLHYKLCRKPMFCDSVHQCNYPLACMHPFITYLQLG